SIAIHITDQHAHGNGNVAHVCTIIHVKERNRDSLNVGHASEIDRDLRPAHAETAHAPGARSHCRALDRDGGSEVNNHLIIVCGSATAAFDSHVASEWQRDIEGASSAMDFSRERV